MSAKDRRKGRPERAREREGGWELRGCIKVETRRKRRNVCADRGLVKSVPIVLAQRVNSS